MDTDALNFTKNGRPLENLVGQRFNKLTVIGYHGKNQKGKRTWDCICDCGNKVIAQTSLLKSGHVKSCGCFNYDVLDLFNSDTGKTTKIKNFTGKRFGMLTAVEPTTKKRGTNIVWKFKCDCGVECERDPSKLNEFSNCGCRPEEALHRKNLIVGENDLSTTNPEISSEWDYSRNLIKPTERTAGSNEKVYWICPQGHSYCMPIIARTSQGQGCPYCGGRQLYKGLNDFETNHPELIKEWDFEKNKMLPSEVTKCTDTVVHWICPKGHKYAKALSVRVRQTIGCPYCSNKKALEGFNDLKSTYPELLKYWDYEKNRTISPTNVTYGSGNKVWWKCDKGHSYEQRIDTKIQQNQGCPYCANLKILKGFNDLLSQKPDIAEEWNYEKNDKRPDEYTYGSYKKVWWKCKLCGYEWRAVIGSRVYAQNGCPRCAFTYQTSQQEQIVFYYIKKAYPDAINSYKADFLGKREIDIFIPSLNLGIEYDGHVAHNNTIKDAEKTKLLKQNGIALVRFRDDRLATIEDDSFCIPVSAKVDTKPNCMEEPLKQLFNYISSNYEVNLDIDVDILRDYSDILALYESKKKERSLEASGNEIVAEWNYDKNGKLSPDMVTYGSSKIVWWKCSTCGAEWQMPVNQKKGLGCEKCRRAAGHKKALRKKRETGQTHTLSEYPELLAEWDYKKNVGVNPEEVSFGSGIKVWWLGKCGHSWQQVVKNRTIQGQGCPQCRYMKAGQVKGQMQISDFWNIE